MSDDDSPQQINLVRIGEHDVVPLEKILDSLKIMAEKIRKQSCLEGIKDQLKGYNWLIGDNPDKWQMMKALAVAVNEAIQEKKIEPVDKNSKQVNEKLYDLLARGNENMVPPKEYFRKEVTLSEDLKITSPRVLAEVSLLTDATHWVVASMIERQFAIKWDTVSGEPDDYSFYDFCDTEKTKKFFKYIPRLAHVKATLYKECRSKQKMLHELLQEPKNSLCPEVCVKTVDGWTTWKAPEEENKEGKFRPLPEDWFSSDEFSWIDQSILQFITDEADVQKPDLNSLKQSLKNPTLYWAVIKDRDFPPIQNTKNLELMSIGQTQVYVGKANNGIERRWTKESDNHCEMMKKCLDNVCAMTTYDPMRLEGIQLVDARLALAKVREKETEENNREKTALFVIKTFGDDLEKAKVAVQKAQKAYTELSGRGDSDSDASEENHPARSSQSLRKAWDKLQSAKSVFEALSKDSKTKKVKKDPKKKLEEEERHHRQGRRDKSLDIIPDDKYKMKWEPKLMGYGMNKF